MKKTFFKNLCRDILKTFSRFLSIVIIIAIGVAFYAGVRATSPDMQESGDFYLTQNNFMDFKLIGTLGLTKEDVSVVEKQNGILKAEGSFSIDGVIEKNKQSLVVNINSMPSKTGINLMKIVEGRAAGNNYEAVVEERFLKENKLKLGDEIEIKSGKDSKIEDNLKNNKFKIVGAADSPLYLSAQRQLSSVGNGSVKGFVYILPEVFKSDVYSEIYVKVNSEESGKSLINNEDYKNSIENIELNLKNLGVTRSKVRYEEVLKASQGNSTLVEGNKAPSWYVLGRSANVGYESYRQDSDRIGSIGKSFPFIFFLVAALVSLTTMTRLVQENRTEIGTFKALGYSRLAIVSHYLIYSLVASLTGSVIGISFGFKLFPALIMNAYQSLYTIPNSITSFNSIIALQASLIAILFTTIAAVLATLEELRKAPASLMRPKAPKFGKKILLERATFIWKKLSFTEKVTARNIFRYKQRLFMTVIGIAACTGLMLTGFGLRGAVTGSMEKQFNKIYKYDMLTTLNRNVNTEEKDIINTKTLEISNVKSILFAYSKNATVKDTATSSQDVYVVVPENKEELNKYIDLTLKGKTLNLEDEGVIITQKLSKLINKKVGDTIQITINDKEIKAKISAITEHYVQHYIYMSSKYYQKITGEALEFNEFYGMLKSTSEVSQKETTKTLTSISNVGSVSYRSSTYLDFNKSMKSINSVVLILIMSAGVLAFVVIYNLTNINISERKRELATIKLLGFYNNELALYIYRENMILTLIGSITGIGVGLLLNSFVLNAAETNIVMFYKTINPIYFLYSVLLTIFFSIVVNIAMYWEFDKIDMIESLKNAE